MYIVLEINIDSVSMDITNCQGLDVSILCRC